MDKARRNELRDLKWKRRLKTLGLQRTQVRDFICYRDQGKPCSCYICSPPHESKRRRQLDKQIIRREKQEHEEFMDWNTSD